MEQAPSGSSSHLEEVVVCLESIQMVCLTDEELEVGSSPVWRDLDAALVRLSVPKLALVQCMPEINVDDWMKEFLPLTMEHYVPSKATIRSLADFNQEKRRLI